MTIGTGVNATLIFENCSESDNTVANAEGLVGGGIYGYTTWANGGFAGSGVCADFTNWNGIKVVTEGTTAALKDAIASGASEVVVPASNYTVPSSVAGKDVIIVGSGEDTVFNFSTVNNVSGASIVFENLKITGVNANSMNNYGIQSTTGDIVYKNCIFENAITNEYFGTVTYIDCTFIGTYYITTYSVKSASFINCVFDRTDSRALLVYSHGNNPLAVTVKGCTFTADAKGYTWVPEWTAAIEVDTTNIPSAGTTVTIEDCKYDENYNGIVRDKSAAGRETSVITVDGVVVDNTSIKTTGYALAD